MMLQLTIGGGEKGMGLFEFIAALVGSLAWPVAAVIIAFLFRSQIAGVLARLKELAWGDTKATFIGDLKKIDAELDAAGAKEPNPFAALAIRMDKEKADALGESIATEAKGRPWADDIANLMGLVVSAPDAAVLSAWIIVTKEMEKLAAKHEIELSAPKVRSVISVAHALLNNRILNSQAVNILHDLRKIRNTVAHGDNIDTEGAVRYIQLVSRFLNLIEDL